MCGPRTSPARTNIEATRTHKGSLGANVPGTFAPTGKRRGVKTSWAVSIVLGTLAPSGLSFCLPHHVVRASRGRGSNSLPTHPNRKGDNLPHNDGIAGSTTCAAGCRTYGSPQKSGTHLSLNCFLPSLGKKGMIVYVISLLFSLEVTILFS